MRFVLLLAVIAACRPPGYGKHRGDEPTVDAPAATDDASNPDGTSAATCDKAFRLDGHGTASSVWLTGDFIQWGGDPAHGAAEFTLGVDGGWTGTYTFDPGPHQYKFIVSGTDLIADPTNPDQVDDGFGGKNSLYTCAP